MKCDAKECEREATVHLTEIVNGNITKLHLCEDHAKQKGVEMEQHFGIADLLQGLAEYGTPPIEAESRRQKCPNCGMVYEDFKKSGRLGCSECYRTFQSSLGPLLKRIHGAIQHVGKVPAGAVPEPARETSSRTAPRARPSTKAQQDIDSLKEKLRKAIETESYEEAARLRDEIRSLEKASK